MRDGELDGVSAPVREFSGDQIAATSSRMKRWTIHAIGTRIPSTSGFVVASRPESLSSPFELNVIP